jgi:hypothetical protein
VDIAKFEVDIAIFLFGSLDFTTKVQYVGALISSTADYCCTLG